MSDVEPPPDTPGPSDNDPWLPPSGDPRGYIPGTGSSGQSPPPGGYPPPYWQGPQPPHQGISAGRTDPLGRPLAPWWKRAVAFIIDWLILNVLSAIVVGIVDVNGTTSGRDMAIGLTIIVILGYFSFLDGSGRGQTVGKMALGIATRDLATGAPLGAGRALIRRFVFYGLFFVFLVPGILNAMSPLWDPRRQAWHDKLVGSCVVQVR